MIPVPQRRVWTRVPRDLPRLLDWACFATLFVVATTFTYAIVWLVQHAHLLRVLVGGVE